MPTNGNAPPIRAILFDYGEVLCASPARNFTDSMAEVFQIDPETFRKLYYAKRQPYDRGSLSAEEYWSSVASAAGVTLREGQLSRLREYDVTMWSQVHDHMLQWAADLRSAGIKTGLLSNMHRDMVQYARDNFQWLADFDCVALSAELGMAKPEAAIYIHCVEALNVSPEETLFLDDKEVNVLGAKSVGMRGIVTQSMEQLRADLEGMGVAPLPADALGAEPSQDYRQE
jgi:putative hydrolase of the HAD superfamily